MKLTLESQRSSVTPLFLDFEDSLRVLMSMFLFHMKSLKMCSCDQLSAAQFQKLFEELDKDAIKQVGIWWSFMKSLKLCMVLCDNIVPWSLNQLHRLLNTKCDQVSLIFRLFQDRFYHKWCSCGEFYSIGLGLPESVKYTNCMVVHSISFSKWLGQIKQIRTLSVCFV